MDSATELRLGRRRVGGQGTSWLDELRVRSLMTMEWPEWLMVDDVEHVETRFGRGNFSSSSSLAVFTCAVPGTRMTKTRRDLT